MNQKKNISRLTIDLSKDLHTKLKVQCALENKTMRDLVRKAITKEIEQFDNNQSDFIKTQSY